MRLRVLISSQHFIPPVTRDNTIERGYHTLDRGGGRILGRFFASLTRKLFTPALRTNVSRGLLEETHYLIEQKWIEQK